VKLVTIPRRRHQRDTHHFNPHEREARDLPPSHQFLSADNFNPHEREARDCNKCLACGKSWILIHTSVKLVTQASVIPSYFNPHEREARDFIRISTRMKSCRF